jgi:hypothetical protein
MGHTTRGLTQICRSFDHDPMAQCRHHFVRICRRFVRLLQFYIARLDLLRISSARWSAGPIYSGSAQLAQ